MKHTAPARQETPADSLGSGTRYLDKTQETDISALAAYTQQTQSSYYHNLLDVLLVQKPEQERDLGHGIESVAPLHEASALETVLAHFCPSCHQFLRRYLELAHSVTGIGAVRLGLETEVFLKALLALQQLVSHPDKTTRASSGEHLQKQNTATDSTTLQQWVRACRPNQQFEFTFSESQEALLASLSLLQRLIIQNLVLAVLGWSGDGKCLKVNFDKIQRRSTGRQYLNLVVSTPDNLMGKIVSSTLKGPKQASGQPLKLEGSGLGYHLAASLIAQLQGELVVAQDESGGTRFELHFPLQTQTERYLAPGFILGDELAWMEPGIGFSVVYVEDVKSHAMLVKQILNRMTDIKLLVADTGQRGLDLITLAKPDLVLLDMELPDMNGLEVFMQLQQRSQTVGIPVVAISASAMSHQISHAQELGIRHYLSKPFSHQELLSILREAQQEKSSTLVI